MKPIHAGLWLGLGYTLPAVVWLLGTYDRQPASGAAEGLRLVIALTLVQAVAVILFAPWRSRRTGWREEALGICMLLMVPLPLLAVCWLTGAVDASWLLRSQLALLALGLSLWLVSRLLTARLPAWSRPAAITVLQGGTAGMLWCWREAWLNALN